MAECYKTAVSAALIVFDLDGTLVDSRRDLADSTNDVLVRAGGRPLPLDEVTGMVGDGARALVERALARAGLDVPIDRALGWFRAAYDRRLVATTRPYPGVPALLDALAARARLAVLTNKPEGPARGLLRALELLPRVGTVIGGDGPHGRKPDPSGLQALMRAAGAEPGTTLLVGDSMIDVVTARRAGAWMCVADYGFGRARGDLQLSGDELRAADVMALHDVLRVWLDARHEAGAR